MQAFALDGFIYTVYHLSNQQTLVRYNPTSDVWEPRAKSSRAGLQRDMAYAVHGGYIYSSVRATRMPHTGKQKSASLQI